jgi:hypothetical protein
VPGLALPRRDRLVLRVFAGGCRPSQGRSSGVGGLGRHGSAALASVVEVEGQVVLMEDLPFGPRGSRHGAGASPRVVKGLGDAGASPSGGVGVAAGGRSRIGRPFTGRGSRSEGAYCCGSGAGRDVKVGLGAPSAGMPRRFFVQEPLGSEGVGSAPSRERACGGWRHRPAPDAFSFIMTESRSSTVFCGP